MSQLYIIVGILCISFGYTQGLRCYTCSVTEDDLDQRCVTDPANVEIGTPITNCNKKYCTSIRQEYIDPKGKIASMLRGCEDKPQFMNDVVEDSTHRYYYRSCQEDLCNDGTGHDTSGLGGLVDQDDGSIIYTKGVGIELDGNAAPPRALGNFSVLFYTVLLTVALSI